VLYKLCNKKLKYIKFLKWCIGVHHFTDVRPVTVWSEPWYNECKICMCDSDNQKLHSPRRPGKVCYGLVQNHLSCHLLSEKIKMQTQKNTVLTLVLYKCETWSVTFRLGTGVQGADQIFNFEKKSCIHCALVSPELEGKNPPPPPPIS